MCGRFACSCVVQPGQNITVQLAGSLPGVRNTKTRRSKNPPNSDTTKVKSDGDATCSLSADCSQFQRDWHPSFNICPTVFAPVLVMDKNKQLELVPMRFGMIPSWHPGKLENFKLYTMNARGEEIMQKRTYKGPMQNGQRCVIPVDGFYEWQKQPSSSLKQPFYFYLKENHDLLTAPIENNDYASKIVRMGIAAVYDRWTNPETSETIRSFAIITVQASKDMNWLHHREPVILENADRVMRWLDSEQYPLAEALEMLKSRDGILDYHPTDRRLVNYPRDHKAIECIVPHKDESNDTEPKKKHVVPKGQPRIDAFCEEKGTKLKDPISEAKIEPKAVKPESQPRIHTFLKRNASPLKTESPSASTSKKKSMKKVDEKSPEDDADDFGHENDEDDDVVETGRVDKRTIADAFDGDKDTKSRHSETYEEKEAKKPKNSA